MRKKVRREKEGSAADTFSDFLNPSYPVPGFSPASQAGKLMSSSSHQNPHGPFLFPPVHLPEQLMYTNPISSYRSDKALCLPTLPCPTKVPFPLYSACMWNGLYNHSVLPTLLRCPKPVLRLVSRCVSWNMLIASLCPIIILIIHYLKTSVIQV